MDNNNEYKRNVGMTSKFPSYGETPKTDNYSGMSDYGSISDYSSTSDYSSASDYSSTSDYSNTSDYSSMSNYESTTASDFGKLGDLGSVPDFNSGETDGYYRASYNENNYYRASINEQDDSVEQSSEKSQGNYYRASYYEAEEAGSTEENSTEENNMEENNTEEDRGWGTYGDQKEDSSLEESNSWKEDRSKEDTSPEESDGGMSQSDYQALYSDYDSSQVNNYRTSPYSAGDSASVSDEYTSDNDYANGNGYTGDNDYAGSNGYTGDYDYADDHDSVSNNSYTGYNTYSDYNAPEEDHNSPSSSYGDSSSYSSYGNSSDYGNYGSASGVAEGSGMSGDSYTSYHGAPLDRKGRPLKNNFGMKLAFAIIELVFATFWGILALIFTCMANSAFQKGDWDAYQSRSKVATVMLWIGLVLSILSVVLIGMFVGLGTYGYKNMSQVVEENVQEGAGDKTGDYEAGSNIDDTDNTDVADNTDTADAADGSTATGGSDFVLPDATEYNSFTINGLTVSVPSEVSDYVSLIESLGYTFDANLKNTTLQAHEDEYIDFMDRDGLVTGFIDVYNTTDGEIMAEDGIVGGIYLDVSMHEDVNITYINGIDNHSSAQAYVEALGEPKSVDESFGYYQWYTEEGWISVEIHDGELSSLSIYAYAMLK